MPRLLPVATRRDGTAITFDDGLNFTGSFAVQGGAQLTTLLFRPTLTTAVPVNAPPPGSIIPSPGTPGISPNFAQVVEANNYVVPAGTVFYTDSLFYMFRQATPPGGFINNGALWNIGANAWVISSNAFGQTTNNGLMVANAPGGWAYGIEVTSSFGGLVNNGQIYAIAANGRALGVSDWGFGHVINYGLIAAQSLLTANPDHLTVMTRAIERLNGGLVVNYGQILAEGPSAEAVTLRRGMPEPYGSIETPQVRNEGLIHAVSTDPNRPSVGVLMGSLSTERVWLANYGTIRADIAIGMGSDVTPGMVAARKLVQNLAGGLVDGRINMTGLNDVLLNDGTIHGDITLNGGHDAIHNKGAISGTVNLGAGNDLWFSRVGQMQGSVLGGDGADAMVGGSGADTLDGEGGDDVLQGDGGADQLTGGAGKDVFVYAGLGDSSSTAFDTITDFASGTDRIDLTALAVLSYTIQAGTGFTLLRAETAGGSLEVHVNGALVAADLILAGTASIAGTSGADVLHATAGGSILTGSDGDDALFGAEGNDRLDGGADAGGDTMWGAGGDDVYTVTSYGDAVVELAGQGTDLIELLFQDYRMPDNVEHLIVINQAQVIGNNLNNNLTGGAQGDGLSGGFGRDVIYGNGGNDYLDGGDNMDKLVGGAGNDRLAGGGGADWLEAGAGADTVVIDTTAENRPAAVRSDGKTSRPDVIADFTQGEDKIDLRVIDAVSGTDWNEAFSFIGTGAFTGQAGQMRYQIDGDRTCVYADRDGDGWADFHIVIAAPVALVATDFML